MHDKLARRPTDKDDEDPDQIERVTLTLLLDPNVHGPGSVRQIGRELGEDVEREDAVASLHGAGLVHRRHDLAFPTRAAACCLQLAEKP